MTYEITELCWFITEGHLEVKADYAAKLQLAFGSDGTLYGHQTFADANSSSAVDGNFWKV